MRRCWCCDRGPDTAQVASQKHRPMLGTQTIVTALGSLAANPPCCSGFGTRTAHSGMFPHPSEPLQGDLYAKRRRVSTHRRTLRTLPPYCRQNTHARHFLETRLVASGTHSSTPGPLGCSTDGGFEILDLESLAGIHHRCDIEAHFLERNLRPPRMVLPGGNYLLHAVGLGGSDPPLGALDIPPYALGLGWRRHDSGLLE